MNDNKPALTFLQTVRCDDCQKDLFKISQMYAADAVIVCESCGAQFTLFMERAADVVTRTLTADQAKKDRLKLSELLAIRLRSFETQTGMDRESAAMLFQTYLEGLLPAVLDEIDKSILRHLQGQFLENKDKSISNGSALLLEIETAAAATLESSGYELQVDVDEMEEED